LDPRTIPTARRALIDVTLEKDSTEHTDV
jgi:hypothetical protein